MDDNLIFQSYLVAFLDLVGQREALRKLLAIPATPDKTQEFIEAVRHSLGKVLELRRDFASLFNRATHHNLDLSAHPPESQKAILDALQTEYSISGMSDAIVIAVPLGGDDENYKGMNGVHSTILAICDIAIEAFGIGMMFRGGLDVGIATQISEREVYGSALVRAYHLESEVAEYPRFVVGDALLDFIQTVQNQVPETAFGKLAQQRACRCRRMIVQDTDGRQMLDFLGTEVRTALGGLVPATKFSAGRDFARGEYEKFRTVGQDKLASRYFRLVQYYLARQEVWGL